ncbi:hypothetical protein P879_03661 [Paragonimus westermani]|uniref:POU domain protein n=1 Tax=Paragonimus westermani TaxID=34504 RepID=A0A8T0DGX3_9TREM|nr:hypothetical protein P879_03661 [Paragonimus westermani]
MRSRSLTDALVPFSAYQASFRYYITFVNIDGCKVHVPVLPSCFKRFRGRKEKELVGELRRKMTVAFAKQAPEYRPLLKPHSEFFLKAWTSINTESTNHPVRSSERLHSARFEHYEELALSANAVPSNWSPKPVDLYNLESFARAFTAKRCELNLGQVDVARSLKLLYGVHRSSTLISRVERMDLSLNNFLQIYPVLLQWLKDTEFDESRDAIIRAALDTTEGTVPSSPLESLPASTLGPIFRKRRLRTVLSSEAKKVLEDAFIVPASTLGPIFRKRRLRTVLSSEAKKVLEDAFIVDAHPPTTVLKHLASILNLDTHVVRVWFYNRRSRRCRPKLVRIN